MDEGEGGKGGKGGGTGGMDGMGMDKSYRIQSSGNFTHRHDALVPQNP